MSRLPPALQPAWPLIKRGHRFVTLVVGCLLRALSRVSGGWGVPRTATGSAIETSRREPDHVSVHAAGPAEQIVRGCAGGQPPGHWVFERGRTAQIPPTFVLDVRGGRLVGDYGAVVTPGNVLDYETSPYFGIAGWREHPIFLRPQAGDVEHLPGTVLSLTARGATANYYHFLYDAIARYGTFEHALPGVHVDAVVVPHQTGYQKQLLAMVGIEGPFVQPRSRHAFTADRLLVPSVPNHELDAPRSVVEWLRKRLPPSGAVGTPKRLYLSRGRRPHSRRYVEEPELLPLLERRGFVVVDPGTLSVQDQIDVFHGAEVVVAPHGAALTNITFCSPGAKVLELFAPTYVHLGLWAIADAIGGIDYRYLVAEGPLREGKVMAGVLDDVSIPVERLARAIDELLDVP